MLEFTCRRAVFVALAFTHHDGVLRGHSADVCDDVDHGHLVVRLRAVHIARSMAALVVIVRFVIALRQYV